MEPLKEVFNSKLVERFSAIAADAVSGFDARAFKNNALAADWQGLELKQRMRRLSESLHVALDGAQEKKIADVVKISAALRARTGVENSLAYIFLPDYVEVYGLGHPERALEAMEELTISSSCEFAIRPFIEQDPEGVLERMQAWTKHAHSSVRRLASEGCRPRLPWGRAVPILKKEPGLILPILTALKADESLYVRKSVANSLNDISKDHPELLLGVAREWIGSNKHTDWILKHACRGLLKKSNKEALALFGIAPVDGVDGRLTLKAERVLIGEALGFSVVVENNGGVAAPVRIEYAIGYVKAGGKMSRKVFKITETTFGAGEQATYDRNQSFADMTTRKHYGGRHTIALIINGEEQPALEFEVQ